MFRKYVIPLVAIAGFLFAIFSVVKGSKPPATALPVSEPAEAPFASYVAGAGIIETPSENIEIGTIVPGVVQKIYVKCGDRIKAGDPLFEIDGRDLEADLLSKKAALFSAQAKLAKAQSLPRPEDVPPAEAAVREMQGNLDDAQAQFDLYQSVTITGAITRDEYNKRKYAVEVAQARLAQAKANLAELMAGSWDKDLAISQADVATAQAAVDSDNLLIDRLTVRSPIDGEVLQEKVHLGEYAQVGPLDTPLMLLGDVDKLVVRTDIDENDAWRIRPGAGAVATLRGNRNIKVDLTFLRVEPYVIPKKSLTGDSTERVDTRVLQVLYSFDRGDKPMYVGQQMDVFIDSSAADGSDYGKALDEDKPTAVKS